MNNIKKKQLKELKKTDDIEFILNESYKIIGNPIVLHDTSYNLLEFTKGIVTDDRLWNEFTTLGTFSQESINLFIEENFILDFAESEITTLMRSSKLKYDRLNGKLFDSDNVQIGNITVIGCCKPFEDGDRELTEFLCEILSVKLQKSNLYKNIDKIYKETLFSELLDKKNIVNLKAHKQDVKFLYEKIKSNLYLAVVDISGYDKTITQLAYLRDLFRKLQPEFRYVVHLNNIIILLSTDKKRLNINEDLKKLNEFFSEYNIYAGVSSMFNKLVNIKKYYKEAINALNYGLKNKNSKSFYFYDNYMVEHFLNTNKEAAKYSHPVLNEVALYDKKHNSSFLNILNCYFLSIFNVKLAAKKLGITERELKQKLKMLEKLFNIDFKDADMLFSLFSSIKMLDIVE